MRFILNIKFAEGTSWAAKLLETGDEEIVEYCTWKDVFWGWDINLQKGENHLGKMLMEIRESLKSESTK